MAPEIARFSRLSDHQLLAVVTRLAGRERQATAALIASLAELDARRLYLGEGCSSLFTYCTRVLHLSEHAAYHRIEAARAVRRFPIILVRLEEGALTLTTVRLLAPHLTPENHTALLEAARHKSKSEVERLVAAVRPQPDVRASVRRLPAPALARTNAHAASAPPAASAPSLPAPVASAPTPPSPPPLMQRPVVKPLAPTRYKVQFTLDDEGVALLRQAQALMRHRVPDGDIAAIVAEGLKVLVERLEKTKTAATPRPRTGARPSSPRSRTIPATVRRAVWARDQGRCAFVGAQGRCAETGCLEFHHVRPYAAGGSAEVENIELRCRAHNQYEAELAFGGADLRPCGRSRSWATREGVNGWPSNSVQTEFSVAACRRDDPLHAGGPTCPGEPRTLPYARIPFRIEYLRFPRSAFPSVPIVQRPRTRPFQGRNAGSNPAGDAILSGSIPET